MTITLVAWWWLWAGLMGPDVRNNEWHDLNGDGTMDLLDVAEYQNGFRECGSWDNGYFNCCLCDGLVKECNTQLCDELEFCE
jgi:hypothetical protein